MRLPAALAALATAALATLGSCACSTASATPAAAAPAARDVLGETLLLIGSLERGERAFGDAPEPAQRFARHTTARRGCTGRRLAPWRFPPR